MFFASIGHSQSSTDNSFDCQIKRVLPFISFSKKDLKEATTLKDINPYYKADWIKEYVTVETRTTQQGKKVITTSENDVLTQEQKKLLASSDIGSTISIRVRYIPNNNLQSNDVKETEFSFIFEPETMAIFRQGETSLLQYLQKNVVAKLPEGSFEKYDLAAITFSIDEQGKIKQANIWNDVYQTYENEYVQDLLLSAIQNMPDWIPAQYTDGTKVKQDFVLAVGNLNSCLINALGVRKLPVE